MKGGLTCLVLMVAMVHLMVEHRGEAAMTCQEVFVDLSQCVSFANGDEAEPSVQCCFGVRKLKESVPTVEDRQQACECIKQLAWRIPGIKDELVSQLPKKCHVAINVPIKRDIDCRTIP